MSIQPHQHFIERFTALFNEPNLALADEIFAPGFKSHVPLAPEVDAQGWTAYVQNFMTGFPDLFMDVHEVVATEDRLVLRVTYRGTHTGTFQGVPPSGKSIAMPAIGFFHLENGRAVENWGEFDVLGVMMQIGRFPRPPREGEAHGLRSSGQPPSLLVIACRVTSSSSSPRPSGAARDSPGPARPGAAARPGGRAPAEQLPRSTASRWACSAFKSDVSASCVPSSNRMRQVGSTHRGRCGAAG